MTVEYRVLGPLEVLLDGVPVAVPAGRGRVLLATLLLRANEFVPVDELVERVWDGEPPAKDRAHKTLQTVVLRLRRSLGAASCVRTSSRGYSAEVAPGQLDLARFRELTAQGEHRAALELWRGPVLANVLSDSLHREDVPRLEEERAVALERRIDADLAVATDVLVPELRSLTRTHPFREVFWAQLMLALHRDGQQAEALAVYQEIRKRLADELGVDPGRRLLEAHEQVLSGEVQASAEVPRQLPLTHSRFVGRERELARLTEMLHTRRDEPVLIAAINGVGGVGKTSLAVHWAHQVAHHFPDGQIYVNLRGFDSRAEPVRPLAAISNVLLALGVSVADLRSEEALVAHYRSVLARRRVLLLLDNARDADQVRPLLPGTASNLVLITSRNQLRGLVAREGARPVTLDLLDEQRGLDLLTSRIGAHRVAAEPEAAARLVAHCAGLPLALSIVAARAAYDDSLTALAGELAGERLDALDVDDSTGVRAVFSWSLRSLSEDAARMFVLLGLHPGPDLAVAAAASLAGLPLVRTRRLLGELVAGSLLDTGTGGRYALHDLLRDFAAERVADLPAEPRAAALRRMFDHYLHTTHTSWQHLQFNAAPVVTEPPAPDVLVEPVADADAAWARFDAEYRVLLSAVERAGELGEDDFAWKTMFTLHDYLSRKGHIHDAAAGHRVGLAAAERLGDLDAQSLMHRRLASTQISFNDFPASEFHLREAIRCAGGNVHAEAHLRRGLAFSFERQERFAEALEVLAEIHPRMADDQDGYELGRHLAAFGRAHHKVGDGARALELCLLAAERFAETEFNGQDAGPAGNQETLGDIYLGLGRYTEAVESYERALRVWQQMRAVTDVASCLILLGTAFIQAGEPARAREHLTEALRVADGMLDRENFQEEIQQVHELLASVTNV
ncbi:BTAD domain-containing putative transcriptional regulator [Lentzea sp. HUAS TT2]|uniref:AfsR/SARP family transcriptional regulator n=1 Tax=Lentzea sp. HUAS TT2 TaxID=3447454 RepID=UPI003F72F833